MNARSHRLLVFGAFLFALAMASPARAQSKSLATEPTDESYTLPPELSDARPEVRSTAIRKLVAQGETRAMGKIAALARKDQDPSVREVAAWAVGEMDIKMRKSLLRSMAEKDESGKVQSAARKSLEKLEKAPIMPSPYEDEPQKEPEKADETAAREAPLRAVATDGTIVTCAERAPATTGFAWGAGVFGFLGTGGVGGLYISAAIKREELVPAIPLAAAGTGLTVITAVIVAVGSKSARGQVGVDGAVGLRLFGWLTFGFHLIGSAVLALAVPFHWVKEDEEGNKWTPNIGWILANGAAAMLSLVALSADSLIAASEAQTLVEDEKRRAEGSKVSMAPFLAPYATSEFGTSGAVLGFAGTM